MRFKKMIPGCTRLMLTETGCFTYHNGLVHLLDKELEVKRVGELNGCEFISDYKDDIIIKDDGGKGFLIDKKNSVIKEIENFDQLKLSNYRYKEYLPVYIRKSIYDQSKEGIYSLKEKRVLWLSENCKSNRFVNEYFVGYFDNFLFRNDIQNGELLWQFSFEKGPGYKNIDGNIQPAELSSIIGAYKNKLWLHVKQFYFLALDIETGIVAHQFFMPDIFGRSTITRWQDSLSIGDLHLDADKGIIKSLAYWRYWEFDLNTFTGTIKKEFGHATKENPIAWSINQSRSYPGDKNLYFIGKRSRQVLNDIVGVFDTELCDVTWYDKPLQSQDWLSFSSSPQSNDKYMAVQDSKNNLWVYEK